MSVAAATTVPDVATLNRRYFPCGARLHAEIHALGAEICRSPYALSSSAVALIGYAATQW